MNQTSTPAATTVRALSATELQRVGGGEIVVTRQLDKSSLAALLLPAVQAKR